MEKKSNDIKENRELNFIIPENVISFNLIPIKKNIYDSTFTLDNGFSFYHPKNSSDNENINLNNLNQNIPNGKTISRIEVQPNNNNKLTYENLLENDNKLKDDSYSLSEVKISPKRHYPQIYNQYISDSQTKNSINNISIIKKVKNLSNSTSIFFDFSAKQINTSGNERNSKNFNNFSLTKVKEINLSFRLESTFNKSFIEKEIKKNKNIGKITELSNDDSKNKVNSFKEIIKNMSDSSDTNKTKPQNIINQYNNIDNSSNNFNNCINRNQIVNENNISNSINTYNENSGNKINDEKEGMKYITKYDINEIKNENNTKKLKSITINKNNRISLEDNIYIINEDDNNSCSNNYNYINTKKNSSENYKKSDINENKSNYEIIINTSERNNINTFNNNYNIYQSNDSQSNMSVVPENGGKININENRLNNNLNYNQHLNNNENFDLSLYKNVGNSFEDISQVKVIIPERRNKLDEKQQIKKEIKNKMKKGFYPIFVRLKGNKPLFFYINKNNTFSSLIKEYLNRINKSIDLKYISSFKDRIVDPYKKIKDIKPKPLDILFIEPI